MHKASASYQLRRALLRIHRRLGWSGVGGLALLALALPYGLNMLLRPVDVAPEVTSSIAPAVAAAPSPSEGLALPTMSDAPLVLNRIRRSAEAQGLGWPRAEYRQQAATDEVPASVEVHCALKGSYPQIRVFLTEVLLDSPSTAIRNLSVTRATSESAEVEAKLVFVTYFREGQP